MKFSRRQEFVVGGYKPANAGFDSVLVGYYKGARLLLCGKGPGRFHAALTR